MSIIIKEMDMPTNCAECGVHQESRCGTNYKWLLKHQDYYNTRRPDCPLIEIDLIRCGECEYADEYNHCKYSTWWNGNADFCSHGIRRKESR